MIELAIKNELQHIKKMGKVKEAENLRFRTFLKMHDLSSAEIDAVTHQITHEIVSQIDCMQCANCCKQIRPVLDQSDASRFALGLKIIGSEFQKKYLLELDNPSGRFKFTKVPCPFLADNRCTNYAYRPEDCRSFPHLHKKDFVSRLFGVIDNYEICPIVFHVVELLKIELRFHEWAFEEDFDWL